MSSATPDTAASEVVWGDWRFLFCDGRCPCGTVCVVMESLSEYSTFVRVDGNDGMPYGNITSMAATTNHVWFGTTYGLVVVVVVVMLP